MLLSQDTLVVGADTAVKPVVATSTSRCCSCGLLTFLPLFFPLPALATAPTGLALSIAVFRAADAENFALGLISLGEACRPLPGGPCREMELLFHLAGSGELEEK